MISTISTLSLSPNSHLMIICPFFLLPALLIWAIDASTLAGGISGAGVVVEVVVVVSLGGSTFVPFKLFDMVLMFECWLPPPSGPLLSKGAALSLGNGGTGARPSRSFWS